MAYKTWTFTASIGSTNTNENHVDYINAGSIVGSEDYILSGQKGTIDLVLHVNGTENQTNWKACTTVEMVLMSAPACYPRLSKYQQKRVVSEKITSRSTTDGGGSCTLTAENAFVLHAGNNLYIGAVGYDSTGAVVRTTNMQYACTIEQGADMEELTDGANMSLTAAETLRQQIAGKMDAAGYTDAVGEIPVVNAAGNLKVRPVEFAIDNNDNFVLRGTESQVIASIPKSQLSTEPEKVSGSYWSGYKYADGRAVLKWQLEVQNKALNLSNGVYVTNKLFDPLYRKYPNVFIEKPEFRAVYVPSPNRVHVSAYATIQRGNSESSSGSGGKYFYLNPPDVYLVCMDNTNTTLLGDLYMVAEGRWK